jgi:hypothetical protein
MRKKQAIEIDLMNAKEESKKLMDELSNFSELHSEYDRRASLCDLQYVLVREGELQQEMKDVEEVEKAVEAKLGSAPTPQAVMKKVATGANENLKMLTGVETFAPFGMIMISKSVDTDEYWGMYSLNDASIEFNDLMDKMKIAQDKYLNNKKRDTDDVKQ